MLHSSLIGFLAIFLFNCSQKTDPEVVIPKFNTHITGEIINYDPVIHDYTVTLHIPNIVTDDSDVALTFVDSLSSTFKFNFNLESPQMIIVRYAGQNFNLYVIEKDSIHIEIEIDIDNEYPPNPKFSIIDSQAKEINKYLDLWIKSCERISIENALPEIKSTNFHEYHQAVQGMRRKREESLLKFISDNGIDDIEFIGIAKEMNEFDYVDHLIHYYIQSDNLKHLNQTDNLISTYPDLEMEETLPKIIDSLEINDPKLLENSYFHYFFNFFSGYVFYKARDLCRREYSDCTETLLDLTYVEYVGENFESQTLQFLISRYLFGKIRALEIQKRPEIEDQFASLLELAKGRITLESQTFLEVEFERVKNLIQEGEKGQIVTLDQNVTGIKFWDNLIETYRGQVVYVKFWAPWCGPCMSNWKSVDNLTRSYSSNDLNVLAVCIDTEESKWQQTIHNLTSSVDHIYLDRDQSNIIRRQFGISSIPRNIIIDRNGILIHSDAPESGSKEGQLNRHLEEIILNAL